MDFDFELCKENVQPLRGGRNRAQLEVALQAQENEELQKELSQQRQEFETLIKTYEGDDPLNNWYSYISWVEQSYPKHGHEGNLLNVLEDCLGKFENDQHYVHDRRMCKLWIKYIDLQQNPDELFQLLHSKSICISCADLYRAWAFYHEIAGDYKRANAIYQLGMQNLAQPYEELEQAQKNMFMAAGRQIVSQEMSDQIQQQMEEQRHALTSLRSYKHKTVVPSQRVGRQVLKPTPGALPLSAASSSKSNSKSNKMVTVYTDENKEGAFGGYAGPVKSVLEVARRKEHIKENTLKPGPWTILKPKKRNALPHLTPTFKVHEDDPTPCTTAKYEGIRLPDNFHSSNLDDFSDWKVPICNPEPENPKQIFKYPKEFVYSSQNSEYSIEEIKARKYRKTFLTQNQTLVIRETEIEQELFDEATNIPKNNFEIFDDQSENKKYSDSSNFDIFQDDGPSISHIEPKPNMSTKPEKFSIYSEENDKPLKSSLKSLNLGAKAEKQEFSIYCEELEQKPQKSSTSLKNVSKPEKHEKFSIFCEESESRPQKSSKSLKLPTEPEKQEKFSIFCEETESRPQKSSKSLNLSKKPDKQEKFSIFCEDDSNPKKSHSKSTSAGTFSIYSEDSDRRKKSHSKSSKSDYKPDNFPIFEDSKSKCPSLGASDLRSRAFGASSSLKDDLMAHHREGFSLSNKKTDTKVDEYVRNLVAKLPVGGKDSPELVKLDKSSVGEGSSSNGSFI